MPTRVLLIVALVSVALATGSAAPRYSPWSTPTYFGAVNTAALEFANAISKDGLSFYFQRGDAAVNGEDIWVVHRPSVNADWGEPQKLSDNVNSSTSNDRAAFVSPDGHWLFFASDRPEGGRGGSDLMVSWRPHVHEDFGESGWQPATNLDFLGFPINTAGFDSGPTIFVDEETGTVEMYFVSNPTGPQNNFVDVYRSFQNSDGSFGPPELVDELSDPLFNEGRPYIRHDGLEIFFQSNRVGSLGTDIWVSTRPTITAPWSMPHRVQGDVNTIGNDVTPALSWDAQTLYFASTRTGLRGEIFFSTRQKVTGKPLR
jgi:hypothetical protein